MKAWIGWDPGTSGAMALITEVGGAAVVDWTLELEMYEMLKGWKMFYHIVAVAVEKQHGRPGNSSASDTTFQQHTGACRCIVKLAGFEPVDVRPQEWMKRRVPAKASPKDKPSVPYIRKKYPYVNLSGPRGGIKDGRADAICIAEWCKEVHHE